MPVGRARVNGRRGGHPSWDQENAPATTSSTAVAIGAGDTVLRPWILDGYEAHADAMTTHVVEGAGHFVVDDRPDEVLRIFDELVR